MQRISLNLNQVKRQLMFKASLACLILFSVQYACAQPGTEVYLFDLKEFDGELKLSDPKNVSNNPGYDNQPSFTKDGRYLLYSSLKGDQTDIIRFDLIRGTRTTITNSPGSEYSPTETPDGKYISTIILKKSGEQLLWKYPLEGGKPEIVVPDLVIGYHCWLNKKILYSFVLGEPPTLQLCNTKSGDLTVLSDNIGRSIQKVPGQNKISFVQKNDNSPWLIMSHSIKKGTELITNTVENSEDFTWTPNGAIIMGDQSKLYVYDTKLPKAEWVEFADLSVYSLSDITRLAIAPNGRFMAVVVSE